MALLKLEQEQQLFAVTNHILHREAAVGLFGPQTFRNGDDITQVNGHKRYSGDAVSKRSVLNGAQLPRVNNAPDNTHTHTCTHVQR